MHSNITTPLIVGDTIYGIGSHGQVRGLRADSGERIWEAEGLTTRGRWASAHFVRHEDRYFVYNENGDLIIAQFTPEGYVELDRTHLLAPTSRTSYGPTRPGSRARRRHGQSDRPVVWAHPAFANRHVVLRNDEEIIRGIAGRGGLLTRLQSIRCRLHTTRGGPPCRRGSSTATVTRRLLTVDRFEGDAGGLGSGIENAVGRIQGCAAGAVRLGRVVVRRAAAERSRASPIGQHTAVSCAELEDTRVDEGVMTRSASWMVAAGLLLARPMSAQTAVDVVDQESLRAFVERAADLAESRTDAASAYAFFDRTFRPEGEWRSGEIYLFVVTTSATVVFHATNPELEGRDDSQVTDKNGVRFVVDLIEAAQAGGGFVEYHVPLEGHPREGELKVAYAAPLELDGADLVIASGYHPTPVSALPFMESLRRWLSSISK